MIFCQVTKSLVDLIIKHARGRCVVDVGAGEGLLGKKFQERGQTILSIDFREPEEMHSAVLMRDALTFPFTGNMFPVFLRPCHSDFVHQTIVKNCEEVKDFLYVSKPENLEIDLDLDADEYDIKQLPRWRGKEGERAWLVTSNLCQDAEIVEFGLVQIDNLCKPSWWELRIIGNELFAVNSAGGRCPIEESQILERAWTEDYCSLDWTKTDLYRPELNTGWLSPTGEHFGCNSMSHDSYARLILKKEVQTLEDSGWVRIYCEPDAPLRDFDHYWICMKRLTPEQRKKLDRIGYKVDDDD